MAVDYITRTEHGGFRIAGTRVSLDSIVHAYWNGQLPEVIVIDFPSLSLEQVHGAIAYYLGHRSEIDEHLAQTDVRWRELQRECAERLDPLSRRLRAAAAAGKVR